MKITRILSVLLFGVLTTLPALAGVGIRSVQIVPGPDGKLYSAFPSGNAPPAQSDLTWDIADALVTAGWDNLLVGTSKNTDVRQYLSGANSASGSSTITLSSVTGTTPATAGITITSSCGTGAGSCLSYDGVGAASTGTFRLVATDVNGSVNSAVKSFTIANPASVPGQVVGVAATVNSSSAITITWTATAGATSYKAKRGGAVIQSGVACCSYQHTGLAASTQYSFTMVATNGTGDGTESSAVLATTASSGGGGAFDPDYPRLFCRQCLSNMSVLNPDTSLADFNTAIGHMAKYHASMGGSGRTKNYGGGSITPANIMQTLKAHANYDAATGSGHCKYTNVTQIDYDDSSDAGPRAKALIEENNGANGDWYIRPHTATEPYSDAEYVIDPNGKVKMNYSTFADPDHNGNQWTDWFAKFEFSATTDDKDGFTGSNYGTGNDFVASSGKGLRESAYDCVFEDDMAMLTGDAKQWMDGNDFDEDGTADFVVDTDIKNAMSGGFVDLYNTWQGLFATQSPRTLQYVLGNITAIVAHNDYWPTDIRNLYNGGLVEEFSGKTKTQGFGNLTTNDSAIQPYTGVLGMYKRAMEFTASPRIVAMGHEPYPEFRTKWGCKWGTGNLHASCNNATKPNNWISKGGSCSSTEGVSATPPAECKYPGRYQDFSDYRLMRWALTFVMMDDGFFSTNQTSTYAGGWNTGLPWYDEYVGGTQVNEVGWCGQPLAGSTGQPQYASYEQGGYRREFDNCIAISSPPRGTPTVDQTKTYNIPAAGSGKRWKRLCAKSGGYTTDGTSGTQDATVNDGSWVGAENTATTISLDEFDGILLWRAPAGTALTCP